MQGLTVRGLERLGSRARVVRSSREGVERIGEIMESGRSPLDSIVRNGARRMLQAALESAGDALLEEHAALVDESGRRRVVRHGYLPSREIATGSGGWGGATSTSRRSLSSIPALATGLASNTTTVPRWHGISPGLRAISSVIQTCLLPRLRRRRRNVGATPVESTSQTNALNAHADFLTPFERWPILP